MRDVDVDAVLDVQEPGAIAALADIFPQDQYPFPRTELRQRWLEEIVDPNVQCFVVRQDENVVGFAALCGAELRHFGTAIATWGSGLASTAHDELLAIISQQGKTAAWLKVFEANIRARRFYVKHGWTTDGDREYSTFPPYPVLLRYARSL